MNSIVVRNREGVINAKLPEHIGTLEHDWEIIAVLVETIVQERQIFLRQDVLCNHQVLALA